MVINDYFYVVGDTRLDNKSHIISSVDRTKYMTNEYVRLASSFLSGIKLDGRTALLVAGGPMCHHSESRVFNNQYVEGSVAIKSQFSYSTYNVINKLKGVSLEYLNINGNTCSSSMHCIDEAYDLIHNKQFDHVIILAMEQVEESELLLFRQLGIDLVCGDGACFLVLSKECENAIAEITSTTFIWNNERHPMFVSKEGYIKTMNNLSNDIDIVKPHGTGTGVNDVAELDAIKDKFPTAEIIGFKQDIGHTQGASAAIELAMIVEKMEKGKKALCLASGLGGFYGGCTVTKL